MIYEDNDCVYRYRLITITIKSVEILLFVFVFWVNGYNKQKRREKKSMCVCVCVCGVRGSCMIWYDIIINEDDDEEHSFNTRAASTHTHTRTPRKNLGVAWPHPMLIVYSTRWPLPSAPRSPGVSTVKQKCYPILFHYTIYILPRSVVSIYVRLYVYVIYAIYFRL